MAIPFLEWLTKKQKPLAKMTRQELRRQELLLEKQRGQLLNRLERLAREKKELFNRGAGEKTPEVRRVYAQEFEMKTTEQLMIARQLNIRCKEVMTVARLRMLRENADRGRATGGKLGLIGQADILKMGKLIEADAVTSEMYQDRLDEILAVGTEVDEGAVGLSDMGRTVMNIWDKMDSGDIGDETEAFDEADRRVREQQSAAAAE